MFNLFLMRYIKLAKKNLMTISFTTKKDIKSILQLKSVAYITINNMRENASSNIFVVTDDNDYDLPINDLAFDQLFAVENKDLELKISKLEKSLEIEKMKSQKLTELLEQEKIKAGTTPGLYKAELIKTKKLETILNKIKGFLE